MVGGFRLGGCSLHKLVETHHTNSTKTSELANTIHNAYIEPDVIPYRVASAYGDILPQSRYSLRLPILNSSVPAQVRCGDPIPILQTWYDMCLPGVAGTDVSHDPYLVENSPLELLLEGLNVQTIPKCIPKEIPHMMPKLMTNVSVPRKNTMNEVFLALLKRNLNVPDLQGFIDEERVV